jgi:hypothetical protein
MGFSWGFCISALSETPLLWERGFNAQFIIFSPVFLCVLYASVVNNLPYTNLALPLRQTYRHAACPLVEFKVL